MGRKDSTKEIITIIIASLVLALVVAFNNANTIYIAAISFLIIITVNVLAKKIVGSFLEINTRTKFWTWHRYGFRKDMHFKKPIPMLWVPLLFILFTKGLFLWLGILEFDVTAKTERVSRRHGLYRFTEVTEWHVAWIATWALIANLILAIIGYIAGFEMFTKLSIYFIAWSIIPISRFDGAKMFYASRALWTISFIIAMILLFVALTII